VNLEKFLLFEVTWSLNVLQIFINSLRR
jgi:hypothetical protein